MLAPPPRTVDRSAGTDRDTDTMGATNQASAVTVELAVEKRLEISSQKNGDRFHTRDVSGRNPSSSCSSNSSVPSGMNEV